MPPQWGRRRRDGYAGGHSAMLVVERRGESARRGTRRGQYLMQPRPTCFTIWFIQFPQGGILSETLPLYHTDSKNTTTFSSGELLPQSLNAQRDATHVRVQYYTPGAQGPMPGQATLLLMSIHACACPNPHPHCTHARVACGLPATNNKTTTRSKIEGLRVRRRIRSVAGRQGGVVRAGEKNVNLLEARSL